MALGSQGQKLRVRPASTEADGRRSLRAGRDPGIGLICRLAWGLGDVLLSTSAIREYRRRFPDTTIAYQTYDGSDHLQYPHGHPAELLQGNPDISLVLNMRTEAPGPLRRAHGIEEWDLVDFHYAHFGGPSLDYPIQAHYWENLGLEWQPGQRFDCYYYPQDHEIAWARTMMENFPTAQAGPTVVITPHTGWAGKGWSEEAWLEVLSWAVAAGWRPIVLAGIALPWATRVGVMNLSGTRNMRETAAILQVADHALMTEGGLSNLRFALGKPAFLLTCATQVGIQIWTPPELTTEIRMVDVSPLTTAQIDEPIRPVGAYGNIRGRGEPACSPCMWRRDHVKHARADLPPANIKGCPVGRSLRDIQASFVIERLEGFHG